MIKPRGRSKRRGLPKVSDALKKGQISYSKARAATRVARPDNEKNLLIMAKDGTASQLERLVRYYRKYVGDEEQEQTQRQREKQYLQTYTDDDGMVVVRGRLPPEVGAMLQKALDTAADALRRQRWEEDKDHAKDGGQGEEKECCDGCSAQNQEDVERSLRVEALGLVAEQALKTGLDTEPEEQEAGSARQKPAPKHLLVVHVDAEVLADPRKHGRSYVEDVGNVPAETSKRLACDAQVVEVVEDKQGNVLDVGRKTRKISRKLALALGQRDGTCQFPGCGRTRHLDTHHIEHWSSGGETNLDNLYLTCRHHHTLVHEGGFTVEGTGHALVFRDPRGRRIEPCPGHRDVSDRPVGIMVACHRREGLAITAETNRITWAGEPIEYGWAVEALMPRQVPAKSSA